MSWITDCAYAIVMIMTKMVGVIKACGCGMRIIYKKKWPYRRVGRLYT